MQKIINETEKETESQIEITTVIGLGRIPLVVAFATLTEETQGRR